MSQGLEHIGRNMAIGEPFSVSHGLYTHHGIDAGDGTVIHYSGELFAKVSASVSVPTMNEFADDG